MLLSDISIKRPVFATVINVLIVLLGIVGLMRLGVREYPNIDVPVVSVNTTYTGANPSIVETQVTKILEDAISGVEGIDFIDSSSGRGRSSINITFRASRDLEQAANDVRDRVSRAKRALPDEVSDPIVQKSDADADPVMILSLSSTEHNRIEITQVADKYIKSQLELLDGVANIALWGGLDPVMRIWLDPQKLATFGLSFMDVETALRKQNIEVPSGSVESAMREFSVVARTDLNTAAEFANIILKVTDERPLQQTKGRHLVRLGDVARVELGGSDEERRPRLNGNPSVAIAVIKQSVANPLALSNDIKALLPKLSESLPDGMQLSIGNDTAIFIEKSLQSVYRTIFEALLFVGIVVFIFLRSLRTTLIPMVTVPISLMGTLFVMYLLGYSINTLTLLAFVLAIGLVVDDAIVVLENIHRHIEKGVEPMQAAWIGAKEIGFAVIAMTITLAAVFLPLTFAEGRVGQLFIEFAVTLSTAVLISGFTALTLSPMMCSRLLTHQQQHGYLFNLIENGLNKMTQHYQAVLTKVLSIKLIVMLMVVLIMVASIGLFSLLPSELMPTEDRGRISLVASAPEGASVEFVDQHLTQVQRVLSEQLPHAVILTMSQASGGRGFISLEDWSSRHISQMDTVKQLAPKLASVGVGLRTFIRNPASLGQRGSASPVEVVLRSSQSYEVLDQQVGLIMEKLRQEPNLINVDNDLQLNTPQIEVRVDREKMALLGIDVDVAGKTLETALGGRQVTRYKEGADQYDVIVRVDADLRKQATDLTGLYVRAQAGVMVPLANIVTLEETVAPQTLKHFNKLRSITFSAGVLNISQGQAIERVEQIIGEVINDALIDYSGPAREFKETGRTIYGVLLMALVFIYLVLAAQFESWRDPLIILFSLPLAGLGALGALYLTQNSLNIYSQIGLITLVGLITKHGILIVEFANQLQEQGVDKCHAVIQSACLRLRPILMTTGAMVLGALPLALATGAGAESRQVIGWVIVGGMLVGTCLTLFIVPTAYVMISKARRPRVVLI